MYSKNMHAGNTKVTKYNKNNDLTKINRWVMSDTASANCPRESVLPIRLWPDFSVVFGGCAAEAVNRPPHLRAQKRSLCVDIL